MAFTSFNAAIAFGFGAALVGLVLVEIGQRIERAAWRRKER